jgi:hypothetical protein
MVDVEVARCHQYKHYWREESELVKKGIHGALAKFVALKGVPGAVHRSRKYH